LRRIQKETRGGNAMRKVKDAVDLTTGEKIYFKGHAKATYLSDGSNVEDAIINVKPIVTLN
jgi:hypothetical protein